MRYLHLSFLFLLFPMLVSCSSSSKTSLFSSLPTIWGQYWNKGGYTQQQANQLPAPFISVSLENGGEGTMILYRPTPEQGEFWVSRDGSGLNTFEDRIVDIYFPNQRQLVHIKKDSSFSNQTLGDLQKGQILTSAFDVDFPNQNRFNLRLIAEAELVGDEDVLLWGEQFKLQKIVETLTETTTQARWQNFYWRDAKTGFIWVSSQYWGAGPRIVLKVIKPWEAVKFPEAITLPPVRITP